MLIVLAALAAAVATPPAADPSTVAAISSLETRWGQAFVKRDFDFIDFDHRAGICPVRNHAGGGHRHDGP